MGVHPELIVEMMCLVIRQTIFFHKPVNRPLYYRLQSRPYFVKGIFLHKEILKQFLLLQRKPDIGKLIQIPLSPVKDGILFPVSSAVK